MEEADHQRLLRNRAVRRRRQRHAQPALQAIDTGLRQGLGVRELARLTGVPKSTISDLKKRLTNKLNKENENDDTI